MNVIGEICFIDFIGPIMGQLWPKNEHLKLAHGLNIDQSKPLF